MKYIKQIRLVLLLIPSLLFSQDKDFQSFLLSSSIAGKPGYSTEIPMSEKTGNAVIIKVIIDGKPFDFLFDTGAMISLISKEAAGKAKYLEKITITDNLGHDQKHNTVKKNVLINDIEFKDIGFAIMDFSHINQNSCLQIDGIFGANAIKLCNWQIDPSTRRLKLSDVPFSNEITDTPIDLKYHAGLLPLVSTTLNNANFLMLLDTGDDGLISLNRESYKNTVPEQVKAISGEGVYKGTFNSLLKEKIEKVELKKIQIGTQQVANVQAIVSNDKSAIGYRFLQDYITTINTEVNKLYLKPITQKDIANTGAFDINFCRNEQDELIICFIWDKSALKASGLNVGDKVVMFNGTRLEKLSDEQYCMIKEHIRALESITIKIRQGKQEKAYNLIKSEF
jgi:predicted aspartyl protease